MGSVRFAVAALVALVAFVAPAAAKKNLRKDIEATVSGIIANEVDGSKNDLRNEILAEMANTYKEDVIKRAWNSAVFLQVQRFTLQESLK